MAARRCTLCGVSYPNLPKFATCPVHDEPTDPINKDPDADWQITVQRLLKQAEAANELARPIPLVRGVPVVEESGLFWIDQGDLHRAGVRLSRMIPDQFHLFELDDGWIYETQGWDEPGRRWWVERVIPAEGGPIAK